MMGILTMHCTARLIPQLRHFNMEPLIFEPNQGRGGNLVDERHMLLKSMDNSFLNISFGLVHTCQASGVC